MIPNLRDTYVDSRSGFSGCGNGCVVVNFGMEIIALGYPVLPRSNLTERTLSSRSLVSIGSSTWMLFARTARDPLPSLSCRGRTNPGAVPRRARAAPGSLAGTSPGSERADAALRLVNTLALLPPKEGAPAPPDRLREAVLASVTSPHSKRNYAKAFEEVGKYLAAASQPLARETLFGYRAHLLERGLSPSTINVQLSAIRKLVAEGATPWNH
jgi:hypothetical protein